MSKIFTGILGAIAVSMSFGAVQFALGRDLSSGMENARAPLGTPEAAINRAAKADRPAGISRSAVPTQTISLKLDGLSATSVLVRVPVAQASRNGSYAPSLIPSGSKPNVACEAVVSVLTEVAKQLQPGRCVT
jgi:hypothetical protein